MKKSPDRRDRTRKSRGARLEACAARCAGRAAGFCFPARRAGGESALPHSGSAAVRPCLLRDAPRLKMTFQS